jgi:hypothetical protein
MADFDEDGICPSETVRAAARVVNQSRRFPIDARMLQDAVDFLDRTVNDDRLKPGMRLAAVETFVKMEALNQVDEIKSGELANKQQVQERTVLLLPPNGTEKRIQ